MKDRAYFFRHHLKKMPVSLAYWRCFESERYTKEKVVDPVLDIGCGDGDFVRGVFQTPLDAGIDLDAFEVEKARGSGSYKEVHVANVTKLPFESDRFNTVISNCVLEHIPPIDEGLREIARVMKSGATFMFTVPTEHYSRSFFWDSVLSKLGMPGLGKKYVDTINGMFAHCNLNDSQTWDARLKNAGLKMVRADMFISRAAMRQHERWFPIGFPSKIWQKLFKRKVLLPRFFIRWFAPIWFRKSMWTEDSVGVCYLIVAQKP